MWLIQIDTEHPQNGVGKLQFKRFKKISSWGGGENENLAAKCQKKIKVD